MCGAMWDGEQLNKLCYCMSNKYFRYANSDATKQDLEIKLNLICQAQSTAKTTGILTKVFSNPGPNLVILARTRDELSSGQAKKNDFEVKFDLKGPGQSPPKQ